MPPIRTFTPTKPMKTERTHEENQERAYIAASRRSDRSLEARVESARRASEIHKRRTGRSLRVTEQDVINEEMYEEEDDDLPMQYRRLTAHLQTGSADFNRRLAAYLTNHVAMRSALDHAITQSYAQHYSNAPQFLHNQPGMFPSPLLTQGISGSPHQVQQNSPRSPHPYRQAPYPMPGSSGFRPPHLQHHRSSSMTLPQEFSSGSQHSAGSPVERPNENLSRRMSMPAAGASKSDLRGSQPPNDAQPMSSTRSSPSPPVSRSPATEVKDNASMQQSKQSSMGPPPPSQQQQQYYDPTQQYGLNPFTMSLPQESQMLLGSALDPNDPFTSMLMAGSNHTQTPTLYDPTSFISSPKPQNDFYPSFDGMNSTLAPNALSLSPSHQTTDGVSPNPAGSLKAADSLPANYGDLKGFEFSASQASSDGGSKTPVDGWDAFINDASWAESVT